MLRLRPANSIFQTRTSISRECVSSSRSPPHWRDTVADGGLALIFAVCQNWNTMQSKLQRRTMKPCSSWSVPERSLMKSMSC